MELHHRARRGLEEQSERAASSAEASNRTNQCGMNVQVPHSAWTPALFGSLGLKRSDPSFRCHSKGLAEKFDECARLPIADLGSNRLHSTSLNQQLYSFHQTHL